MLETTRYYYIPWCVSGSAITFATGLMLHDLNYWFVNAANLGYFP